MKLLPRTAKFPELIEAINEILETIDPGLAAEKRQRLQEELGASAQAAGHPAGNKASLP
jgi:hypothetical protein